MTGADARKWSYEGESWYYRIAYANRGWVTPQVLEDGLTIRFIAWKEKPYGSYQIGTFATLDEAKQAVENAK